MKIGIDLGGSHIAMAVIDNLNILEKKEKRIEKQDKINEETIIKFIESNIISYLKEVKIKYEIEEVGLCIPGVITKTKIVKAVNLNIENYELVSILEEKIEKKIGKKIPVKLINDAKAAALAENELGILNGYKRSVFLGLGTGIGSAVLINGKLLSTDQYPGSEFGHMIIEVDGKLCNCGQKGCFEQYGSMKSFKENFKLELGLDINTKGQEVEQMIRKYLEKEEISSKDEKQIKKINKVIDEFIKYLSIGISNIINIFEPEIIAMGGSFCFLQDIFIPRIQKYIIENNLLYNKRETINIKSAILRNDAGILGSIL